MKSEFQQIVQEIESRQLGAFSGPERDGHQILSAFIRKFDKEFQWPVGLHRVLVVGTNGKGSACATLGQILKDQGRRVGTFTSPHLQTITERIRIQGEAVSSAIFIKAYRQVAQHEGSGSLSRFELLTAMASLIFQGRVEGCNSVDVAIFEAGIGGRKDATRSIGANSVIVTKLGLDHTELLGPDLESIRREKMAVVRKDLDFPAVVQEQLSSVCYQWKDGLPPTTELLHEGRKWPLGIPGRMGAEAAQLALEWCARAGIPDVEAALSLSKVKWPGRQEFIRCTGTNVLLSGDHNPQGIGLLMESLPHYKFQSLRFLFGVSSTKDVARMMDMIRSWNAPIWLTRTPFRGMSDQELARWKVEGVHIQTDPEVAFGEARQGLGEKDLLVVTGSLYLVGLIRSLLTEPS